MTESIYRKQQQLQDNLKKLGNVAIAFSSGVDSTFLLKTAHDVLGEHAIAITVQAAAFPEREAQEAKQFCESEGIRHFICSVNPLQIEGFADNPPNRCYICKKAIFTEIQKLAKEQGITNIAEGSNMDDLGDYRPGLQAIEEMGILSPLRDAGLYKAEIRQLSKELNLPTWKKPSYACMASRFVYGEKITEEKLHMVDEAEQFLIGAGFEQMRVRMHGSMARIEVLPEQFDKIMQPDLRSAVVEKLKALGFSYVTMDLAGYRTGSMNETL